MLYLQIESGMILTWSSTWSWSCICESNSGGATSASCSTSTSCRECATTPTESVDTALAAAGAASGGLRFIDSGDVPGDRATRWLRTSSSHQAVRTERLNDWLRPNGRMDLILFYARNELRKPWYATAPANCTAWTADRCAYVSRSMVSSSQYQ